MHVMHVFKVYTALPQWGKLLWFQKFYLLSFLKWVSSKSFHCYFGRNAKTESDRNLFWKISRFVLVIKRAPVQQFFFSTKRLFWKFSQDLTRIFFQELSSRLLLSNVTIMFLGLKNYLQLRLHLGPFMAKLSTKNISRLNISQNRSSIQLCMWRQETSIRCCPK